MKWTQAEIDANTAKHGQRAINLAEHAYQEAVRLGQLPNADKQDIFKKSVAAAYLLGFAEGESGHA